MKQLFKNILIFIVVLFVITSIFSYFTGQEDAPKDMSLSQLAVAIQEGRVTEIVVDDLNLEITLTDDTKARSRKEFGSSLIDGLTGLGVTAEQLRATTVTVKRPSQISVISTNVLPFLLPLLIIGFFIFFMARQVQGFNQKAMSFGQSQQKDDSKNERPKVTFKDVAGAKEAKQELQEIVEFLKFPKKFTDLGAKIPKGVLLVGGPGTGKTLLAKAVSGEAGVPFIHISGSEFVEMFVGVGASRVRSLFQKAKKQAPAIIFVDEIDAVGRRRGTGLGGSHDEREQTLNQILVELDGFDTDTNVIVMAATNRPDVLDPALLRPGRFDRRVTLDSPDISDREDILKIHAKEKPLSDSVDLSNIAARTPGFSGADLANLLNEAAILAARKNQKKIEQIDILTSIEKVMLGPERRSHMLSDREKEVTAYHEAGHALVAHMLPHTDPVQKVSIISRGSAAGYMIKLPEVDKHMHTRSEFIEDLSVALAGHATENAVFGEIATGASSDLRHVTELARRIVTDYGMSDKLGPRTFGQKEEMVFLGKEIHEQRDYSESTAQKIDAEIDAIISKAYKVAENILNKHRDKLDLIASKLIEKETLEKEEFEALVGKKEKVSHKSVIASKDTDETSGVARDASA